MTIENKKEKLTGRNRIYLSIALCLVYIGLGLIQFNVPSNISEAVGSVGLLTGMQLGTVALMSIGIGPYLISDIVLNALFVVSPFFKKQKKEKDGKTVFIRVFKTCITLFYALLQIAALIGINQMMSSTCALLMLGVGLALGLAHLFDKYGWGYGVSTIISLNIFSALINIVISGIKEGAMIDIVVYSLITIIGILLWIFLFLVKHHYDLEIIEKGAIKGLDIRFNYIPSFLYPIVILNIIIILCQLPYQNLILFVCILIIGVFKIYKYFKWSDIEESCISKSLTIVNIENGKRDLLLIRRKSLIIFCLVLLVSGLVADANIFLQNSTINQSTIVILFLANTLAILWLSVKKLWKQTGRD